MARELLVMRHAKSSWSDDSLSDVDRPLSKRGKRDAAAMGRRLAQENLLPDLTLVSPAKRARSTFKRLAGASDYVGEVRLLAELYDSSVERLLRVLTNVPEAINRVLLIGHNPATESLVHLLTGRVVPLPTSAIAYIMLETDTWVEISFESRGTLRFAFMPQDAGDDNA